MKWDNDENKSLKQEIMDLMIFKLIVTDAEKITIKELCDAIDEMFDKLIKDNEK